MLFAALFFAAAAEMGCTKQDLDRRKNEGSVEIHLSWEGDTPKGSKFYFYPQGDVDLSEFTLENPVEASAEGWSGNLPAGTYRIIVHNSDAENVDMRFKDKYDQAEIYVLTESEAAAKAKAARAGECICHPDNLMLAAAIDEHAQGLLEVAYQKKVRVTATPTLRVKYLRILFKVDDAIALSTGSLSGVSPSLHCASASCASASERINLTVVRSSESGYAYQADAKVLDLVKPTNASHILTLNLTRPDGTPYSVTVDLTAAVDDIFTEKGGSLPVNDKDHPYNISIELKKIGNDLKADVIGWTEGTGGGTLE